MLFPVETHAPGPEPHLFFGLDLGRRHDPSALVALERAALPANRIDPVTFQPETRVVFRLRLAHRFPLGLPYLELLRRLPALLSTPATPAWPVLPGHPARPHKTLAVDASGVGAPIVELLRRLPLDAAILPITITAGHHPAPDPHGGELVPRRDLLSRLRILFESGRLRIPRHLPARRDIFEELTRLSDTPGAKHDDLALALALAAWPAARSIPLLE
ncbi:MAG: hypothetical protein N2036_10645 [Bryobacteraceae bacterium]|nr:hypothetical protein [Bryobacteraceae bacterium]MCX7604519.1 hypothetical protein [Bryobacteraceae bacterium]